MNGGKQGVEVYIDGEDEHGGHLATRSWVGAGQCDSAVDKFPHGSLVQLTKISSTPAHLTKGEFRMGRKTKQTDIEDAINTANGGSAIGHNSKLTDDERRALTLHHLHLYSAADALVEKAKSDRKAICDQAKADLGKGAVADIKDLIVAKDEKAAKGSIERALRIARWMGLPVGTQVSMFDVPVDDRAKSEGMTAGMEGEVCDPPRHLAVTAHQQWIAGWHEGQAVLAGAFKKIGVPETQPAEQAAAQ